MKLRTRACIFLIALVTSLLGGVSTSAYAAASPPVKCRADADGNPCGYIIFYYNSNYNTAAKGIYHKSVANLASYEYDYNPGVAGYGEGVKNNAAAAYNTSGYKCYVYYNSDYKGASDYVAPHSWRKLDKTYNENASFKCS